MDCCIAEASLNKKYGRESKSREGALKHIRASSAVETGVDQDIFGNVKHVLAPDRSVVNKAYGSD